MFLTHMNNIVGIRLNNLSANASVNFGNSIMKGFQGNIKSNVGYLQPGDANFSPLQFNNANLTNDPDVQDQAQAQI
ncbi:spore germination protein [Anaerobacillus sp. CMMVII]|uniref:spore germination protein n=1 Tax=Anaerobacillus sp. CMMVII TaxID=2755588 RepID=UPI0021B713B4|nr:spore germination protein [Anaerobacillus sp. CMMVII]MCT8136647.1 spore germination protein [Anaerobacillus sp. CMMVII]